MEIRSLIKSIILRITPNEIVSQTDQATLEEAIHSLEPIPETSLEICCLLPMAHVTSLQSFETIKSNGLNPQLCDVFKTNLLYFSYGGIFHRYGQSSTNNAQYPVAFVFKASLISKIDCFFPYDTGAAKKGLYKNKELGNFKKYRVSNIDRNGEKLPMKLVYYFFEDNKNYIKGKIAEHFSLDRDQPSVLNNLYNFLKNNDNKVDHRKRVIECQSTKSIELDELLESIDWVGLPETEKPKLRQLYRQRNIVNLPPIFGYEDYVSRSPADIISKLEDKAKEHIKDRYM